MDIKNVIITAVFRLRKRDEFQKIIENFIDDKNSSVMEIEDIKKGEFELKEISKYIDKIIEENNGKVNITFISNIRDLTFCVYRVFNNKISTCIYFMDNYNYNVLALNDNKEIYEKLSSMYSLKNEGLRSKLYIKMNIANIEKEIDCFIINNNFKYLSLYNKSLKSKNIEILRKNKEYMLGNKNYIFDTLSSEYEKIFFEEEEGEALNYKLLDENSWFLFYFIIGVLRKYGMRMARDLFIPYFTYLQKKSETEKINLIKSIIENSEFNNIDFKEKMAIMSLFILIETKNSKYSSELILKEIIADNGKNVQGYYYMLINILNSIREYNLPAYYKFYSDCKKIMKEIIDYYEEILGNIEKKESSVNKTILIVCDELKLMNHSGTKLAIDIARQIKTAKPEYRVILYCEENFYGCQEENYFINSINYNPNIYSFSYRGIHEKELTENNTEIELYYCENPRDYKVNRIKEYINKVNEINPEVIITTSFCSFSADIVGKNYPIIHLSLGGPNCINSFDMEIFPHKKELVEYIKNFDNTLDENNVAEYDYVGEFKKSEKIINRLDMNFNKEDFIMVSVGRAIKHEIKKEYAEKIVGLMKKYKDIKWIIVGATEIPVIDNYYKEYLNKSIIKIGFHKELGALYRACDIYLNPPREGGGFSMAEAIVNNVPVVALDNMASAIYTEKKIKDMDEYIEEIEKLYLNNVYRQEKIDIQTEIMNKNKNGKNISMIFEVVNKAKNEFNRRKN